MMDDDCFNSCFRCFIAAFGLSKERDFSFGGRCRRVGVTAKRGN